VAHLKASGASTRHHMLHAERLCNGTHLMLQLSTASDEQPAEDRQARQGGHDWLYMRALTDAALGRGVGGVHVNFAHCLCAHATRMMDIGDGHMYNAIDTQCDVY
ncbi:hypothetical protein HaLaN_21237, partial [Haematococcus lacustris]